MRTTAILSLAALAIAAGLPGALAAAPAEPSHDELVARGSYLVNATGCADCHAPKIMGPQGPEPDPARGLSGSPESPVLPPAPALPEGNPWAAVASWDLTAWSGPWGTSFAANLTPDEATGIAIWTEEMFIGALRTGRHMGQSRPILPPMPWQVYRNFNDEDLRAIFAYLKAQPAVHNRVPDPVPPAAPADGE